MAKFCGGIKLNPDTFEIRNGIITLTEAHSDDPLEEVTTPCSQLYDSILFERVKHNGVWILTSAGVDTEIPLTNIVSASCGAKFDGRFFTKDENGVLDFTDRHLLEVLVNPADIDYTITVIVNDEPVEPFEGIDNIFPMDEIDEQYFISVTAEGYDEGTDDVTADTDHIVTITLNPTLP